MANFKTEKPNYENEIWNIADLVRDIIPKTDFNKFILPFVLIRRLEDTLEPTREAVSKAYEEYKEDWGRESENYCKFSGKVFYNITEYRIVSLSKENTYLQLEEYINGFSKNIREIINKFELEGVCKKLQEYKLLYTVCQKFASIPFDQKTMSDRDVSNIYEHLIEHYTNDIAESADDYMTPRDIVHLCTGMLFATDKTLMISGQQAVRTIYDQTCGTGGFIIDAMNYVYKLAKKKKKKPPVIIPYGEEISSITWAMCKANLIIRENNNNDRIQVKDFSENIICGNTLIDDKFPNTHFDYCISNPPYGKNWKKEKDEIIKESSYGFSKRFGAGVPTLSDGSMLFIQNMVSHMKTAEEGGSKGAIILSSSPLANGDAGSGMSNIRRWLLKEDLIECIVKLPQYLYYRTIINTYIWILNTKKDKSRKGKIQLIDASTLATTRDVTIGNKTRDISDEARELIIKTYVENKESDISRIVPITEFMYRDVTLYDKTQGICIDPQKIKELKGKLQARYSLDFAETIEEEFMKYVNKTMTSDWLLNFTAQLRETYVPHEDKVYSKFRKDIIDTFRTEKQKDVKRRTTFEKYDTFTERVPYDQDINKHIKKEILPYNPNAIIDETIKDTGILGDNKIGVVGVKLMFDKYFYQSALFRSPDTIMEEIKELESEIRDIMEEVVR